MRPEHEAEVEHAFASARRVRALTPDAKELANRYFFEPLVRLHRTGEGEPYTGLKDVAEGPEFAIDEALESGDVGKLLLHLPANVAGAIRPRFMRVMESKQHADDNLVARREYVAAYIDLVHYLQALQVGDTHPKHLRDFKAQAPLP